MTTYVSIIAPENTMSTTCLSSMLRLQHARHAGSFTVDISKSIRESIAKAKTLSNLHRVVLLHESCGVSSDFFTKDHPHPIVCAGYGKSDIDWDRMSSGFPYETDTECDNAGRVYSFDVSTAEPAGAEYVQTKECESKIISCSPESLDSLEVSLDTDTYTLQTPSHIYVPGHTLHNVEFCFVGSFVEKYGFPAQTA